MNPPDTTIYILNRLWVLSKTNLPAEDFKSRAEELLHLYKTCEIQENDAKRSTTKNTQAMGTR